MTHFDFIDVDFFSYTNYSETNIKMSESEASEPNFKLEIKDPCLPTYYPLCHKKSLWHNLS